jgi:hypothetical protein
MSSMDSDSSLEEIEDSPQEVIEAIARSKGTITEAFRQKAMEDANEGRSSTLEVIRSLEEIREDHSRALEMYVFTHLSAL